MENWELEFDKKFNHFNENKKSGRRICDYSCDKSYTLEDIKKFIKKVIEYYYYYG